MQLTSPQFSDGGTIPKLYSASGANISPPLSWSGAPSGTKSFAVVVEDPDANGFMHWAVYNIPADADGLPENASNMLANSDNIYQGANDAGTVGYFGPKPPSNQTHRYKFRLFALKVLTDIQAGIEDRDALAQIQSLALAESDLIGVFGNRAGS